MKPVSPSKPAAPNPDALTPEEAKLRIEEMLLAGARKVLKRRRNRLATKHPKPSVYLVRCRKCPAMKVYLKGGKVPK